MAKRAGKLAELEDKLARALADYQNLEKRVASEKISFVKFANSTLISNLLPSLEILEKAASHSQDPGVKMAVDQFRKALFDEGLAEINPAVGDDFDHNLHGCVETVLGSADQENKVTETLSKGYKFADGMVLKHARVKVYNSQVANHKSQTNSDVQNSNI